MPYVDGFVTPLPADKRDAYLAFARKGWEVFRKYGALRHVETIEDQIPDGATTDFRRAVLAKQDELITFSWIIWPDKQTRDNAYAKFMQDPEMAVMGEMPFDGRRMIYGGFTPLFDSEDKP